MNPFRIVPAVLSLIGHWIKFHTLGSSVDWSQMKYSPSELLPRSWSLVSKFPPVRSQLNTGACVPTAVASVVDYLDKENIYSMMFLYYNARSFAGKQHRDRGTKIFFCLRSLAKDGICLEEMWPFDVNDINTKPESLAYQQAYDNVLSQCHQVNASENHIKALIASGHPVIVSYDLYKSCFDLHKSGTIRMPSTGDVMSGGHTSVLVGYDDKKGHYILRNSWGDWVGDKGYFYMPYDYIRSYCNEAWILM